MALEQRRREGAELLRQGVHPAEVARRVGVHRQSVGRWAKQLQQGGMRALRWVGRAGRKARLRREDLRRIERRLKRGPEALGYESGLWTSARVAHLIEDECGVQYHPGHAWRILGNWDGAANGPRAGHGSGMKPRLGAGNRSVGRRLKKSPQREADDRLHRRKRIEPEAAPLPNLGTEGTDAGAAVSLQLEDALRNGGGDVVELLLSVVSRHDP